MIRTRDFAKIKFSCSTEALDQSGVNTTGDVNDGASTSAQARNISPDVDIISLSSTEEKPLIQPKSESKPRKKRKPKSTPPSARKARKWPSPTNYPKITKFFQKTKCDATAADKSINESDNGVLPLDDSDVEFIDDVPAPSSAIAETAQKNATSDADIASSPTKLKKAMVVLSRMDMTKYVNGEVTPKDMRRPRVPSDQNKLDDFLGVKSENVSYFNTFQQSSLPLPEHSMVRIENVDMAEPTVKEEPNDSEGLAYIRIDGTFIGTQERQLMESTVANDENNKNVENIACTTTVENSNSSNNHVPMGVPMEVNDCIDASVSLPSSLVVNESAPSSDPSTSGVSSINLAIRNHNTRKGCKAKIQPLQSDKIPPKKKKLGTVPSYKIVEGTQLAVDAFRYGDIDGVKNYFLTHFHSDHYIGLKKKFSHELYLSEITGRLVQSFIKVDEKYMHCMALQTPIVVEDVEVTAIDANHCPGAVMFLFKLKTGKCILHTGDFRASAEMEEYPEFWNNTVDCIYLDTTYLSKKYTFQSQADSIAEVKFECGRFLKKNQAIGRERCLIVCGAYVIGKEKVWMGIANEFNMRVYIEKERRKAMECIGESSVIEKLTPNPNEANIHVVALANLGYHTMVDYLKHYNDKFDVLLAVRPSGWENKSSKPTYRGKVSILGVQYSEHSSYDELERFVKFLQPKQVISTVPVDNGNLENTGQVPAAWINATIKPNREAYQPTIKDMFRANRLSIGSRSHENGSNAASEMIVEERKNDESNSVAPIEIDDESILSTGNNDSNQPTSNATVQNMSSSDTDYMP